jgi:sec-independent protein translocase protein TatC
MRMGILNQHQLAKSRLWVYLGSFIFAILLPPDSILADILLSLPLIILFELTLLINHIWGLKRI